MDEIMQLVFEIKETIPDGSYMQLVEKIAEVNPIMAGGLMQLVAYGAQDVYLDR
jgi:hypothetical protein